MKTMYKGIIAVILLAALLVGIFALPGCSGAQPQPTIPLTTAETTTAAATTETTVGAEEQETTEETTVSVPETIIPTEPATEPAVPTTGPSGSGECAHKWGDWTTEKAAACTADGSKTRTCSVCSRKQQETIPASGHSYGSWLVQKDADCEADGLKSRSCSVCGEAQQETIPTTGHAWDEGKVTTQPTNCSDKGECVYTCTVCGNTKTTQIEGNHSFGSWQYEEYTYKDYNPDGSYYNTISHRKMRTCTKCGHVERDNTPDHHCERGSDNHKVTIVSEPICSTKGIKRSTCTICGWYTEFEYGTPNHTWTEETKHLTDYTEYTNELDAIIHTCTNCGTQYVSFVYGKGYKDNYKYRIPLGVFQGSAYVGTGYAAGMPDNSVDEILAHPTWQMVCRDYKFDADGYVMQFTVYWHGQTGHRYSQVIHCGEGELEAWFEECGCYPSSGWDAVRFLSLAPQGGFILPYKIHYM